MEKDVFAKKLRGSEIILAWKTRRHYEYWFERRSKDTARRAARTEVAGYRPNGWRVAG
jgi:hypothetical protein